MKYKQINREKKKWLIFLYLCIIVTGFCSLIYIYQSPAGEKSETQNTATSSSSGLIETDKNNLPIVVIDTLGQKIESNLEKKQVEINGMVRNLNQATKKYTVNMKLYEPNTFGNSGISKKEIPILESDMIINVRGQSSLKYPKKQYTIRLIDEYGLENHQELLGMNSHDKWVLNGLYSDKSLLRNHIAYKMGRDTMEYSPDTRFVEVYLKNTDAELNYKDHYNGVYLLTEKIERDKNRVSIEKNSEQYKDTSFIVSRDKIKVGDVVLTTDWNRLEDDFIIDENNNIKAGTVFTTTYPSKKNMTDLYQKGIVDYINKFEYSLRSSNFDDQREGYRKYIDTDSFINFAIINEITKNIDGGEVSTYFHKDISGLMKAGPIWDFDQSLGNTPSKEINESTGLRMVKVVWFERLFQDEAFAKRYQSMYRHYRNTIWSDQNIDKLIDESVSELGPSVDRNRERWYKEDSEQDYEQEIEDMRFFLKNRFAWMDENLNLVNRIKENAVE